MTPRRAYWQGWMDGACDYYRRAPLDGHKNEALRRAYCDGFRRGDAARKQAAYFEPGNSHQGVNS